MAMPEHASVEQKQLLEHWCLMELQLAVLCGSTIQKTQRVLEDILGGVLYIRYESPPGSGLIIVWIFKILRAAHRCSGGR